MSSQNLLQPLPQNKNITFCIVRQAMKSTKETILRESFKLFLAKGYDGTSVPDIERAAKITRGAIFHHFINKEDIFKQSADYFVLSFLEEVNYGEEYLSSSTPLKAFMGKCLEVIEARMKTFVQKTNVEITPASFMSFALYLKDHYEGWQEKALEYEKRKKRTKYTQTPMRRCLQALFITYIWGCPMEEP